MADSKNVRQIPRKTKKRRSNSIAARRLRAAEWLLGLTVLFVLLTLLTRSLLAVQTTPGAHDPYGNDTSQEVGAFCVRSLTVEGNLHYTPDQILRASGLYIGQSIWALNKARAEDNIRTACPYIEDVEISSSLLSAVTVHVTETTIAGAMYYKGNWILVGLNGQGVDSMPVESDVPLRYLYFKGATPSRLPLGQPAMDERCTEIMKTLVNAITENELTGIAEIDMTDKSQITLNWNNQITVWLGTDTNLSYEVAVLKETLPKVLKKHGKLAHGVLDISSYSREELTNQVIFTPASA